jgi:hypothetical protein
VINHDATFGEQLLHNIVITLWLGSDHAPAGRLATAWSSFRGYPETVPLVEGNVALMKSLKIDGYTNRFRFPEHGGHHPAAHSATLTAWTDSEQ